MAFIPTIDTRGVEGAVGAVANVVYDQQRRSDDLTLLNAQIGAKEADNRVRQEMFDKNIDPGQMTSFYQQRMQEETQSLGSGLQFKDNANRFQTGMRGAIADAIPQIAQAANQKIMQNAVSTVDNGLSSQPDIQGQAQVVNASLNNKDVVQAYGGYANAQKALNEKLAIAAANRYSATLGEDPKNYPDGYARANAQYDAFVSSYKDKTGNWVDGISDDQKAQFQVVDSQLKNARFAAFQKVSTGQLSSQVANFELLHNQAIDQNSGLPKSDQSYSSFTNSIDGTLSELANPSNKFDQSMTKPDQLTLAEKLRTMRSGNQGLVDDKNISAFLDYVHNHQPNSSGDLVALSQMWEPIMGTPKGKEYVINFAKDQGNIQNGSTLATLTSAYKSLITASQSTPGVLMNPQQKTDYSVLLSNAEATVRDRFLKMTRDNPNWTDTEKLQEIQRIANGALDTINLGNNKQAINIITGGSKGNVDITPYRIDSDVEKLLLRSIPDQATGKSTSYYDSKSPGSITAKLGSASIAFGEGIVKNMATQYGGFNPQSITTRSVEFGSNQSGESNMGFQVDGRSVGGPGKQGEALSVRYSITKRTTSQYPDGELMIQTFSKRGDSWTPNSSPVSLSDDQFKDFHFGMGSLK